VIVYSVVKQEPKTWQPVLDELIAKHADASEDDVAWRLIEELGRRAAKVLEPVYKSSAGKKGFLSMQVNPKLYRSSARMLEHAKTLAAVAPNVAIKVPAIPEGLRAAEELIASGINVNATVSFTLPQAIAIAESFEKALDKAKANGVDMSRMHPYVTLMLGRLDDHLQRVMAKDQIAVEPGFLNWAGIAVFKKARAIFQKRGYRGTLLAAAYRHHLHWSQLTGEGVILSMPYAWWNQFNASDVEVKARLDEPVDPAVLDALERRFPEFRRAHDEGGLRPEEFVRYGATLHTLNQFISGYHDLLAFVRARMLR